MNRRPILGFAAGFGIAIALAGLHACPCPLDSSVHRIPTGAFPRASIEDWRGENPEDLNVTFDAERLRIEYTVVAEAMVTDILIEVEYEVVDMAVR